MSRPYQITQLKDGSVVVFSGEKKISHGEIYPILLKVLGEEAFIKMLEQDDENDEPD